MKSHTLRETPAWSLSFLFCLILAISVSSMAAEKAADSVTSSTSAAASAPDNQATALAEDAKKAEDAARDEALAEEMREKREQERTDLLREAEQFVATADRQVRKLPYPLNLLFSRTFFDIPLWRYAAAIGLVILFAVVLLVFLRYLRSVRLRLDDDRGVPRWRRVARVVLVSLRNPAKFILPALLLRGCSYLLVTSLHPELIGISDLFIFLGFTFFLFDLVGVIDRVYGDRIFRSRNRLVDTIRPMLLALIRLLILVIAGMHIYEGVTGRTMFSVLAGLGLGGLALALASQETLKNLLGFAAIAFDKAFLVGDPVTIANYDGVVEHIGMRSLQLRTYDGNRVVIPNATAINSNIVNQTRRPYIRQETRIALSPLNSYEKIEKAMDLIREAVEGHEGRLAGMPPVVRFYNYEPGRFIIQIMFWYDANLPNFYDECSRVHLEVCKRLSREEVMYAER